MYTAQSKNNVGLNLKLLLRVWEHKLRDTKPPNRDFGRDNS
jgi:hypothetical protein